MIVKISTFISSAFANSLNFAIAQTLDAQIILVANNEEGSLVEAVASEFGGE